ncbi:hypothetical protein QTP86_007022 [Hemibagrus guttatus]|nr:hypothetical protein QTP86_007022 [Hemibagrus guttatus]
MAVVVNPGLDRSGSLCLSQALLGIKAGYTLDGVPTHRRAHTHSHSHTTDKLEMPINLQCMSLDWGRKPEYPEETPKARGEHANSTHTVEAGIEPSTLESVQRRWKEYFEELMNEENEREKRVEGVNSVEQKVDKIRKDEVRKALKRMKSGKAVGPDDIPVEVWKCLGEAAVEFLTSLFNRVLESERMPEEWRRSVLVPIFKNKDLEKAYDRVPREELWYCMRKSGVAEKYVRVVQDMYERSRTVVRCAVGQTEEFKVEVGLHQGSALSPFLFAIVMDQLSEEVRQESPWTMMFADDIVICSESREQVEENLERWRFALERRGMKVSHIQSNGECGKEEHLLVFDNTAGHVDGELACLGESGEISQSERSLGYRWHRPRNVPLVRILPSPLGIVADF